MGVSVSRWRGFFTNKAIGGERVFLFLALPLLLLGTLLLIYLMLFREGTPVVPDGEEMSSVAAKRVPPLQPEALIRELESAEAQEKDMGSGEWEPLLGRYERLTRSNPENDRAWGGFGRCLLGLDRAGEALLALDHACFLNVVEARHFSARAAARRAMGDLRGALADFSDALRMRPGDTLTTNRLLFVALEMGGASLFERKISEINKARGSEPEATWVLGAVAREMFAGNFEPGMGLMEQARLLLPDHELKTLLKDPIFSDRRGQEFLARFQEARIAEAGRITNP